MSRIGMNIGRRVAGGGTTLGKENGNFLCVWGSCFEPESKGMGFPILLTNSFGFPTLVYAAGRNRSLGLALFWPHLFWPTLEPPGEITFMG